MSSISWLEISLQLDGELVEPATELLTRIAPSGLAVEPFGERHLLRAWIPQDDQTETRKHEFERGLWHLSQIVPFPQPTYRHIPDRDWEAAWTREYRPLPIGQRLLVQPVVARLGAAKVESHAELQPVIRNDAAGNQRSPARSPWNDAYELIGSQDPDPPDPNRLVIYLEPGMAFGTGTHPTTRTCLELLEQLINPGDRVLDLGSGSGILAIAAARLGAQTVLALDIDPQAVQLALANLRHNDLEHQVQVERGSLSEAPDDAKFTVIVANIHAAVILQLLEHGLAERLAESGKLILAGILDDQAAGIERAVAKRGLAIKQRRQSGDWRTLVFGSE